MLLLDENSQFGFLTRKDVLTYSIEMLTFSGRLRHQCVPGHRMCPVGLHAYWRILPLRCEGCTGRMLTLASTAPLLPLKSRLRTTSYLSFNLAFILLITHYHGPVLLIHNVFVVSYDLTVFPR